jgi:hypothetical protein
VSRGGPTFSREDDVPNAKLPKCFIEEYAEWASGVTDAPQQYHRATGAIILSTILVPHLVLETSYGEIKPNLWMMMLAGTTVTRKSTSMDLAMKLLDDVKDDYLMATDGSPEGILTELSLRDGKPSLFHRDEITGFMSQISGRDYLAGMLESFTRLYDCKREKRILRRETIEIADPYLVFMAGGIKTKMEELITMEHIRSGFLPRFFFVTGSTTSDQIRPIGPPDKRKDEYQETRRDKIVNELWRISKYYDKEETEAQVKIGGIVKVSKPKQKKVYLEATEDAWNRIRALKDDAIVMGENSPAPELYTPIYDRLSNTIIKLSILLAGADLLEVIEERHVVKAIYLSQEWLDAVIDFAKAIEQAPEMDRFEKRIDKIVYYIRTQDPYGVSEQEIMKKFRIRKKDTADIRNTLVERGFIHVTPARITASTYAKDIRWFTATQIGTKETPRSPRKNRIQKEDSFVTKNSGHTETGTTHESPRKPRLIGGNFKPSKYGVRTPEIEEEPEFYDPSRNGNDPTNPFYQSDD